MKFNNKLLLMFILLNIPKSVFSMQEIPKNFTIIQFPNVMIRFYSSHGLYNLNNLPEDKKIDIELYKILDPEEEIKSTDNKIINPENFIAGFKKFITIFDQKDKSPSEVIISIEPSEPSAETNTPLISFFNKTANKGSEKKPWYNYPKLVELINKETNT